MPAPTCTPKPDPEPNHERATSLCTDGQDVPFKPGQTIIQAALTAGRYIPHLCYHPEFKPHGSCKLCTVKIDGRNAAACTTPAAAGMEVHSDVPDINDKRRALVQMLFVEGNHFCPSCEKSGNCMLQAVAYDLGVMDRISITCSPTGRSMHRIRTYCSTSIAASCASCGIRASSEVDRKNVFALSGRASRST